MINIDEYFEKLKIDKNYIDYFFIEADYISDYKLKNTYKTCIKKYMFSISFFKYGLRSKKDGAAVIWYDGFKEYWLNGIYYSNIRSDEEWLIKNIID